LHLLGVLSLMNGTFFLKMLEGDVSKRELRRLGEQLLIYYFIILYCIKSANKESLFIKKKCYKATVALLWIKKQRERNAVKLT